MKVELPYREGSLFVHIPGEKIQAILEPVNLEGCQEARDLLEEEIRGDFQDFLKAPGKLLVIVNDGTRPTPTALVLETLRDGLERANAHFIVATGIHRPPTDREFSFIFGGTKDTFMPRTHVHDARRDDMVFLGRTSRGTEVLLNAKIQETDRILIIGSVEPHYFAGFTGGRKGLLPGIAAFKTIEQNHKLSLSARAAPLALEGNPVHEDMMEACGMVVDKRICTIMTVLDRFQKPYTFCAGDLETAFNRSVKHAREVFARPLEKKADVVISCARYPMDVDLYQSQKAMENAKMALKEGGSLILVSSCREGIGEEAFKKLLSSCQSPQEVFSTISRGYKLGYHKAAKIAETCAGARVYGFTELEDRLLKEIFIEPVHDLQAFLDKALAGPGSRVVILPDGSVTVPLLSKAV